MRSSSVGGQRLARERSSSRQRSRSPARQTTNRNRPPRLGLRRSRHASRKEKAMLNPSRPLALSLALIAFVALVLGLATDVGLFGWALAVLLGLYLVVARIAGRGRLNG